jgi:hypothetical protein
MVVFLKLRDCWWKSIYPMLDEFGYSVYDFLYSLRLGI